MILGTSPKVIQKMSGFYDVVRSLHSQGSPRIGRKIPHCRPAIRVRLFLRIRRSMLRASQFGPSQGEGMRAFSPNRFTCEGFLLLLKGCMLGPDDFEFVSGLVFLAA